MCLKIREQKKRMEAAAVVCGLPISSRPVSAPTNERVTLHPNSLHLRRRTCSAPPSSLPFNRLRNGNGLFVVACTPSSPKQSPVAKTRLYVSGLSFRTTEESLRNAFEKFGQLVEINLVMDKIANRPRGFAFLRYSTEEESEKAIEGMHGKGRIVLTGSPIGALRNIIDHSVSFLDGRVIFVEVAKPRAVLRQNQNPR